MHRLIIFAVPNIKAKQLIHAQSTTEYDNDKAAVIQLLIQEDLERTMNVEYEFKDTDDLAVDEKQRLCFQLSKICKLFNPHTAAETVVTDGRLDTEGGLLDTIGSYLSGMFRGSSLMAMESIPDVLYSIQCRDVTSSSHRKLSVAEMEQSIYKDFQLRRIMLMKRLEVTIESFLWSDKALMRETEIRSALRIQQSYLTETPMYYTVRVEDNHITYRM